MTVNIHIWLLAAASAALAETVPLASPTNYIWHTPATTNISGTVMGVPPAYSVMRAEDLAWIEEAAAERYYLRGRSWPSLHTNAEWRLKPAFGPFPVSETNRFAKWVLSGTNEVSVGYSWETNVVRGSSWRPLLDDGSRGFVRAGQTFHDDMGNSARDPSGYLCPDDSAYIDGWRTWPVYLRVTNAYVRADIQNVQRETNSYVRMQMEDGTVSVHTNSWWWWEHPTNFVQVSEEVFGGSGVAAVFTNGIVNGAGGLTQGLAREIAASTVTNWYAELKGLSVLADIAALVVVTGNFSTVWHWARSDVAGGSALQGSSVPDRKVFRLGTECTYNETKNELDDGTVEETTEHYVYEYNLDLGDVVLRVVSAFDTNLVYCLGHNRIASVEAYGQFQVSHGYSARRSTAGGSDEYSTNDTAIAVCPLDVDLSETSDGGKIAYELTLAGSMLEDALYQIRQAYQQWPYSPPLKWPVTSPDRDGGTPTTYSRATETWNSRLDAVILKFKMNPYTSLQSWTSQ